MDTLTNFDLYIKLSADQPYILYSERNVRFSEEARRRLIENRVTQVYISANQQREYGRYVEKHLADILQDASIPAEQKTEILYTSATGVVEDILAGAKLEEGVERTKDVVKHTVAALFGEQFRLEHLLDIVSFDYHIYTHSVNVAAYSLALAQRTGYQDAATLRELGHGAMLHDVGKSRIDHAITHCPGELTMEQWEILKQHPRLGYEMLGNGPGLGEIALDIVLHHHEKMDGTGYPDGIERNAISPFARIITIADIFDALTTTRLFQGAMSSFDALRLMQTEMTDHLDPQFFRAFVSMMGNVTAG